MCSCNYILILFAILYNKTHGFSDFAFTANEILNSFIFGCRLFSKNEIHFLPPGIFSNLSKLEELYVWLHLFSLPLIV